MLGPPLRRILTLILLLEITINVCNGIATLVSPELAYSPLTASALRLGVESEAARWFAAVSITLGGWLLARVLYAAEVARCDRAPLRYVLEALCVGDILYCGALLPFAQKYGSLPGILAPFLLTLLMFAARVSWLLLEDWEGGVAASTAASAGAEQLLAEASLQTDAALPRRRGSATMGKARAA